MSNTAYVWYSEPKNSCMFRFLIKSPPVYDRIYRAERIEMQTILHKTHEFQTVT